MVKSSTETSELAVAVREIRRASTDCSFVRSHPQPVDRSRRGRYGVSSERLEITVRRDRTPSELVSRPDDWGFPADDGVAGAARYFGARKAHKSRPLTPTSLWTDMRIDSARNATESRSRGPTDRSGVRTAPCLAPRNRAREQIDRAITRKSVSRRSTDSGRSPPTGGDAVGDRSSALVRSR